MTPIETVQAIYDALAARDVLAVLALIHPECVLTQDERLPWGGRHVGHSGFADFGMRLGANIDSVVTTAALYEADDEVIQFGHTRGTTVATGTEFDIAEVHRWKIEDGLAVRAHFAIDTPGMLAALEA